jgi:hypothetical protein
MTLDMEKKRLVELEKHERRLNSMEKLAHEL